MKITKYGHACFTVEDHGKLLVVDPGAFTEDLGAPENVAGIVITHEHFDHFDMNAIDALVGHNPGALVIAHGSITAQLGGTVAYESVDAGDELRVGPFGLKFYGGEHAVIHLSDPVIVNLGIMIDGRIYYPGDSFTIPDTPVEVLALPTSAPWLKVAEAMDFLRAIKPRIAFSTHDSLLSENGRKVTDTWLAGVANDINTAYVHAERPIEL